jgi:hypothetical protein
MVAAAASAALARRDLAAYTALGEVATRDLAALRFEHYFVIYICAFVFLDIFARRTVAGAYTRPVFSAT